MTLLPSSELAHPCTHTSTPQPRSPCADGFVPSSAVVPQFLRQWPQAPTCPQRQHTIAHLAPILSPPREPLLLLSAPRRDTAGTKHPASHGVVAGGMWVAQHWGPARRWPRQPRRRASPGLPALCTPARPRQPDPHPHPAQLFQKSGFPGSEEGCNAEPRRARTREEDYGGRGLLTANPHPSRQAPCWVTTPAVTTAERGGGKKPRLCWEKPPPRRLAALGPASPAESDRLTFTSEKFRFLALTR